MLATIQQAGQGVSVITDVTACCYIASFKHSCKHSILYFGCGNFDYRSINGVINKCAIFWACLRCFALNMQYIYISIYIKRRYLFEESIWRGALTTLFNTWKKSFMYLCFVGTSNITVNDQLTHNFSLFRKGLFQLLEQYKLASLPWILCTDKQVSQLYDTVFFRF